MPQISPQQYSVQYNLLENHLTSYLVSKVHGRLGGTSFITNKDRSDSLSIWPPSTTHNPDRHFVMYQFTRCLPYADFPFYIFLLQAQIASFNSDKRTAFNRPTKWFDLEAGTILIISTYVAQVNNQSYNL